MSARTPRELAADARAVAHDLSDWPDDPTRLTLIALASALEEALDRAESAEASEDAVRECLMATEAERDRLRAELARREATT